MDNYEMFYFYDKPIPYKELSIYPIKVSEYIQFYYSIDCLLINKNRIPDLNIIKMSYLDYIHFRIISELNSKEEDSENSNIVSKFLILITMIFKIDSKQIDFEFDENNKSVLIIKKYMDGNDISISGIEFDEIKKIICEYHMVELPDETIDPKLEKALEDAKLFRNKNNEKMGSIEDQFICVMISTSLKLDDIENLTIRKFQKILERVDHKLHYQLYKTAEMNGCEFKSKIHHWMSEIQHDKYAGLLVDYDSTIDKFK